MSELPHEMQNRQLQEVVDDVLGQHDAEVFKVLNKEYERVRKVGNVALVPEQMLIDSESRDETLVLAS